LESLDLDINIRDKLLSSDSGKLKEAIYITQDPELGDVTGSNSVLSVLEINRITGTASYGFYKIPTYTAVTRETERSKELELPVVTCEDAIDSVGVILLKEGDNSRAYLDGDCVIIESKNNEDFVKLADKVALHLLNVF